jgi:ABC-type methionine transport system permease subunit
MKTLSAGTIASGRGRTAFICFVSICLTSCSAGGGSLGAGGAGVRFLGPASGRNRYQAVVYPASRPQSVVISAQNNKPEVQ